MPRSSKYIQEPNLFPYEAAPQDPAHTISKAEYRRRLAEYLQDPAFRQIEGFPLGTDEDILALSDPPYYTACPNPFLPEILEQWRKERVETRKSLGLPDDTTEGPGLKYRREPFAADVSEGKNDPIYNAHSYHTKVPHKAIMRYVLHYTDPGDIVFDSFCGTGMTGVAAQLCGNKAAVESLGYKVRPDGQILDVDGKVISHLGPRKVLLNDLSPVATFIASNYNSSVDAHSFEMEAMRILKEVEEECGWMYLTWNPNCDHPKRAKGKINYTIWSDVFLCPHCGCEMVFWDVAVDQENNQIREVWPCPSCHSLLSKQPHKDNPGAVRIQRSWETHFDRSLNQIVRQAKQVPVRINYTVGKKHFEKKPDLEDLEIIQKSEENEIPYTFPIDRMPQGSESRRNDEIGLTHVHHFYTNRDLSVISCFYSKSSLSLFENQLKLVVTSLINYSSKLSRWRLENKSGPLSGTLYISSNIMPLDAFTILPNRIKRLKETIFRLTKTGNNTLVSTLSATNTPQIIDEIADYIFVDPPFGGNLMYSELNYLWEAWLRVFTNNKSEAIINKVQRKGLTEYQDLMEACFTEFYRQLKPGHWITIEFHNSQNSVWNAIQEGLLQAGFIMADVRTLDKQQGTFKQVASASAVKQDLIISAYKSSKEFQDRFKQEGGTEAGAWAFVRQHLDQLPLPGLNVTVLETQAERMPYLLYDRLVAFHLIKGLTVPLSAGEFYIGLGTRFLARDGMYFTSSQAAEYDRLRLKAEKIDQLTLFVIDEQSAIQWLRQVLDPERGGKPQTYADLQPDFLQQLHQEKFENMPELMVMLEENFLQDETDHWFIPNPDKQTDMDALRDRILLREFNEYLKSKGKMKIFRSEAVRFGFSKAWKERQYGLIVQVAERLPEQALQEDAKLKMYYDNALSRAGREPRQEALL